MLIVRLTKRNDSIFVTTKSLTQQSRRGGHHDGFALSPQNGALQARNLENAPLGLVEPTCSGAPRSDRRSIAPFAVLFELRQSPLQWNNRGCKVFSVVATQTAKPSALRSQRLCLVPSVLFSRTASGECRDWLVKQCGYLHIRPNVGFPGVQRDAQSRRSNDSVHTVMLKIDVAVP